MTNETDEQIAEECRQEAVQESEPSLPPDLTKSEIWEALKRYRRRLDGSRQKDELIDRLMVRASRMDDVLEQVVRDAAAPQEGEIHLDFPVEGGCFSFSCPPSALNDPDVRDALAKGRAILEKLGC